MNPKDVLDELGVPDRSRAPEVRAALLQGAAGRGARRGGGVARGGGGRGGGRLTLRPATAFREVSAAEALELAASGWRILDVREQVEWDEGHIPDATLLPLADLLVRVAECCPTATRRCCVHCAVGARSSRASAHAGAERLHQRRQHRLDILGDWRAAGGAWEAPTPLLTPAQQRRYSRQVLIPEIGPGGPAQAARLEGAAHRRRRPGLAGGALPGGLGHRHHRPGRRRRGRRVATSSARSLHTDRIASGMPKTASGRTDPGGAESRRRG